MDDSSIEERVSHIKAEEYLGYWKELKVKAGIREQDEPVDNSQTDKIRQLKDQLFIKFGEDVNDIFAAFRHYQLDTRVTQEDVENYSIQN